MQAGEKPPKLFGRQRSLHQIVGGGKVADVVLWRKKGVSASILVAATVTWVLFEVAEYHLLTFSCHVAILAMLGYFFWSNAATVFKLPAPKIPEGILSEQTTNQVILALHKRLTWLISTLHGIACGKDLKLFILTVGSLWITSVVGSCFSTLGLFYLVVVCLLTLPALYERYDTEVDYLVAKGIEDLRKVFANIDSEVLQKIPRSAAAETKND